jgi:hypothetical protein
MLETNKYVFSHQTKKIHIRHVITLTEMPLFTLLSLQYYNITLKNKMVLCPILIIQGCKSFNNDLKNIRQYVY